MELTEWIFLILFCALFAFAIYFERKVVQERKESLKNKSYFFKRKIYARDIEASHYCNIRSDPSHYYYYTRDDLHAC